MFGRVLNAPLKCSCILNIANVYFEYRLKNDMTCKKISYKPNFEKFKTKEIEIFVSLT